jgi:hypothetical protein
MSKRQTLFIHQEVFQHCGLVGFWVVQPWWIARATLPIQGARWKAAGARAAGVGDTARAAE